jgi:hypothetical protein
VGKGPNNELQPMRTASLLSRTGSQSLVNDRFGAMRYCTRPAGLVREATIYAINVRGV